VVVVAVEVSYREEELLVSSLVLTAKKSQEGNKAETPPPPRVCTRRCRWSRRRRSGGRQDLCVRGSTGGAGWFPAGEGARGRGRLRVELLAFGLWGRCLRERLPAEALARLGLNYGLSKDIYTWDMATVVPPRGLFLSART
jgi:hypothetical protein